MKIQRVGGAQAQQAKSLGLAKVTRESARHLYASGVPVVLVGNKVGAHAFFKGWHLAHEVHPKHNREGSPQEFDVIANSFNAYLEPQLGSQPAYFIDEKYLPPKSTRARHSR
jgi:hypothetical protein